MKIFVKSKTARLSSRSDRTNLNALRMCAKKARFKSTRHANIFLQDRGIEAELHAYECPYCRRIHIGHKEAK